MSTFKNFSEFDIAQREARIFGKKAEQKTADGEHLESKLHNQIIEECKRMGWIYLHGSMAHKTYRTVGECDFICLMPKGVVVFIECKSKIGKLSPEQLGLKVWMEKLGHELFVVRNMEDFYSACRLNPSERIKAG